MNTLIILSVLWEITGTEPRNDIRTQPLKRVTDTLLKLKRKKKALIWLYISHCRLRHHMHKINLVDNAKHTVQRHALFRSVTLKVLDLQNAICWNSFRKGPAGRYPIWARENWEFQWMGALTAYLSWQWRKLHATKFYGLPLLKLFLWYFNFMQKNLMDEFYYHYPRLTTVLFVRQVNSFCRNMSIKTSGLGSEKFDLN